MYTKMKDKLLAIAEKNRQFLLYSVIGVSGVVIDFIIFIILFNLLNFPPITSTVIAVLFGITNNFVLNTIFNFKKKDFLLLRYAIFTSVGLLGLLISIYFQAFASVFAIDANIMKVVSMPVIVVVQYLLNKHISFRELNTNMKFGPAIAVFLKKNWGLVFINVLFIASVLFFIKILPPTAPIGGPDEPAHYKYNVYFLIDKNRLPVSGQDDIEAYSSCRTNDFGAVPCLYSYTVFPAANYVISAMTSVAANELTGISHLKGARLASLAWGIIFVNALYAIGLMISKSRKIGWGIASLALLPQVMFIFSYINQDAHSLAIGALCVYAMVNLLLHKNRSSILIAGFIFGALLPIAKYNYLLFIPLLSIIILWALYTQRVNFKVIFNLAISTLSFFIIFSSFWFIRNFILYNDILGQSFVLKEMANYHELGRILPYNIDTLVTYSQMHFFDILFNSFFSTLGYMNLSLESATYAIVKVILLALVVYSVYIIATTRNSDTKKLMTITAIALSVFTALAIALVVYNSIQYDFQPQGRYLFVIIPPLAAAIALGYLKDRRFKYILAGIVFIVGYILTSTLGIVVNNYL
jgi:putative flippase GtrA